ncbi:MAG TPA: hypothetical protein VM075_05115 [Anaerolineae bacterium]|nr:hypothetical protein [Anaerolineae bacterium]
MLPDLNSRDVDLESLAQQAREDQEFLSELVEALSDKQERVGYNCLRALLLVADERPELLYPHWHVFVKLLASENTYFKLRGVNLIAAIIGADTENRFEQIFDRYYDLLDDKSVITASYIAGNSGKIARAKPGLQSRITRRLLSIDETHHPPERRDLIKGFAVEAFGQYLEESDHKAEILEFVTAQLESESPKTRKLAKSFLKKWAADS